MLERAWTDPSAADRLRGAAKRLAGELVRRGWDGVVELGAIGPDSRRGRRFGSFGDRSVICFPPTAIVNERYIHIGAGVGSVIGPMLVGALRDATGEYGEGLELIAAALLFGAALPLLLRPEAELPTAATLAPAEAV